MRLPTADELQAFRDRNPHLKIKVTPKGVQIEPRKRQASLDATPADIKKRTLLANAFLALRVGFENRQRRDTAAKAQEAPKS